MNIQLKIIIRRILAEVIWVLRLRKFQSHRIENAWIHNSGVVFKSFRLVPESVFCKKRHFIATFLWNWKSGKLRTFERRYSTVSFIGLGIWTNFFHALHDQTRRLHWLLQHSEEELVVFTRGEYAEIHTLLQEHVQDGFTPVFEHIHRDWTWCFVETFLMPPIFTSKIHRRTSPFREIRSMSNVSVNSKRIFIRRKSRSFKNIEYVVDRISREFSFTPIILEDISLVDQINLFKSADVVLGTHGAGLTNMLWCSQKTKILEIFPCTEELSRKFGLTLYRDLARELELEYEGIYGEELTWKDIDVEFPFHEVELALKKA